MNSNLARAATATTLATAMLGVAGPAFACYDSQAATAGSTATATAPTTVNQGIRTPTLDEAMKAADAMLAAKIAKLDRLKARVASSDRLTATEKESLTARILAVQQALSDLRTAAAQAGSAEELRSDLATAMPAVRGELVAILRTFSADAGTDRGWHNGWKRSAAKRHAWSSAAYKTEARGGDNRSQTTTWREGDEGSDGDRSWSRHRDGERDDRRGGHHQSSDDRHRDG